MGCFISKRVVQQQGGGRRKGPGGAKAACA